jgi:hypothetical protein
MTAAMSTTRPAKIDQSPAITTATMNAIMMYVQPVRLIGVFLGEGFVMVSPFSSSASRANGQPLQQEGMSIQYNASALFKVANLEMALE